MCVSLVLARLRILRGLVGPEIMAPVAGKSAEPVHYKLYGVLYHHGESAGSGHYTVDVLHPNGDSGSGEAWLHIDDEAVSAVRHEDVFGGMTMSGWTTGVLICCFIVALLLLRHDDLFNFSLALEDISPSLY